MFTLCCRHYSGSCSAHHCCFFASTVGEAVDGNFYSRREFYWQRQAPTVLTGEVIDAQASVATQSVIIIAK
jgi:hypothetical protein